MSTMLVPGTGTALSTYINTYTQVHSQIIPTGTSASGRALKTADHKGFQVMGIVILAVAGTLVALFLLFRGYRWYWRYTRRSKTTLLPPSKHLDMSSSRARGGYLPHAATSEASLNHLQRPYYRFGDSTSFSTINQVDEEKRLTDYLDSPTSPNSSSPQPSAPHLPLNSRRSTDYLRSAASRQSMASLTNMPNSSSRNSVVAANPGRRSVVPSGRRVSGAPHSPYSRVEIVPPQPLGLGDSVVAVDKATLNFSTHSGIGSEGQEALFDVQSFDGSQQGGSGHGHSRSISGQEFSAARAAYLAGGTSHARQFSFPNNSGRSSPSLNPSSVPESDPSVASEGPWSDHSSEPRQAASSSRNAVHSIDASSSPLDKLTKELQLEARRSVSSGSSNDFKTPTAQMNDMLSFPTRNDQ